MISNDQILETQALAGFGLRSVSFNRANVTIVVKCREYPELEANRWSCRISGSCEVFETGCSPAEAMNKARQAYNKAYANFERMMD